MAGLLWLMPVNLPGGACLYMFCASHQWRGLGIAQGLRFKKLLHYIDTLEVALSADDEHAPALGSGEGI